MPDKTNRNATESAPVQKYSSYRWPLIIGLALLIKISLWYFALATKPESMIQNDSYHYLANAGAFYDFFLGKTTGLLHDSNRTPGYPLFLTVVYYFLHIPLTGIPVLQIGFNLLTARIVYLTARRIDPRLGTISAIIILFSLTLTIYSIMILTEALFVLILSGFLYCFIRYLDRRSAAWLASSALLLACSVYIRPVAYYLGIAVGLFLTYLYIKTRPRQGMIHVILFLFLCYLPLMPWQYRNYKRTGIFEFSSICNTTMLAHGIVEGFNAGEEGNPKLPKSLYAGTVIVRASFTLLTDPGNLKYFGSNFLRKFAKGPAYMLLVFWLIGFTVGIFKMERMQFKFLLLCFMYFLLGTVLSVGWLVTPRFRVALLPFLAIIADQGWDLIRSVLESRLKYRVFPSLANSRAPRK